MAIQPYKNRNFNMTILQRLKDFWQKHPLLSILIIAAVPRIIAALFAKGYGMHDDHFGPIEQPFMILNDFNVWLHRGEPHAHSIVYPSIHYFLFKLLDFLGLNDPQGKMYVVRFFHAAYSMLTVYFGYKITEKISDEQAAKKAGLILALLWIFPFMSVRNLIEMACIPPIMAGFWFLLKNEEQKNNLLFAGLLFGLAFVFRYQAMIIPGTIGIILLFKKDFKGTILLVSGFFLTALFIQGTADILAWGYPFASFITYLSYNASHSEDYTSGPMYNYLVLIIGILIPPTGLLLIWGFIKTWKKQMIVFLPVLLFFLFHSYFPNKQERFILPIIPMVVILSIVGLEGFIRNSPFWQKQKILLKSFWVWFWVVNSILLVIFSLTYSKKTRCESLYYLSHKQDISGIFLAGGKLGTIQPPLFYLNKYGTPVYPIKSTDTLSKFAEPFMIGKLTIPDFIIFFGNEDLGRRVMDFQKVFDKKLLLEKEIEPSIVDNLLYYLNPKFNVNQAAFIFKIE